jgi:hypothetical protein
VRVEEREGQSAEEEKQKERRGNVVNGRGEEGEKRRRRRGPRERYRGEIGGPRLVVVVARRTRRTRSPWERVVWARSRQKVIENEPRTIVAVVVMVLIVL